MSPKLAGIAVAGMLLAGVTAAHANPLQEWDRASRFDTAALTLNARFMTVLKISASAKGILAKVGNINRAVNLMITPMPDIIQYGVIDYWATPQETFESGRGDCEDYAIAKMAVLEAIGVASTLLIVRDGNREHAVVEVVIDSQSHILDNRTNAMASEPHGEIIMEFRRETQS